MKVLIIHHLEPMWDMGLRKAGKSFEGMEEELARALRRRKFDRIILTRFEEHRITWEEYPNLHDRIDKVEVYAYGWEYEMADDPYEAESEVNSLGFTMMHNTTYCKGGMHSQIVEVPEWITNLRGSDVTICGAFDGECIEDLEIALRFAEVKFKRWNEFIV